MIANDTTVITAVAAASPVGLNAEQTCAAMRADICRIREPPIFKPRVPLPPLTKPTPASAAWVFDLVYEENMLIACCDWLDFLPKN